MCVHLGMDATCRRRRTVVDAIHGGAHSILSFHCSHLHILHSSKEVAMGFFDVGGAKGSLDGAFRFGGRTNRSGNLVHGTMERKFQRHYDETEAFGLLFALQCYLLV